MLRAACSSKARLAFHDTSCAFISPKKPSQLNALFFFAKSYCQSANSRIGDHVHRDSNQSLKDKDNHTANSTIRVRFAPSPTGLLHLGGLRTALYNYLFAKKNHGKLILRIEDTDAKRSVPGAIENIIGTLKWAGIQIDEGPATGGSYGPYTQSQRNSIYKKYAQKLLEQGDAYRCFCDPETLQNIRQVASREGRIPAYDKRCSKLSQSQIEKNLESGKKFTVRLKCPSDTATFTDQVYGTIKMGLAQQDDAVLLKSDGTPTYHLAHPIDDHLMEISHVFRGEEWLASTPKHLAVFRALGWNPPKYVHLPLIFGQDKKKLSKRNGNVDVDSYMKKGYLPESTINFLAFLGWAPKNLQNELQALDELAQMFNISDINRNNPVVNPEKLNWFNNQYIVKSLETDNQVEKKAESLLKHIKEDLGLQFNPDIENVKSALKLCKNQLIFYTDISKVANYFFTDPDIESEESLKMVRKISQENREMIAAAIKAKLTLAAVGSGSTDIQKASLGINWPEMAKTIATELGVSTGMVSMLMRFIITGKKAGPNLNDLIAALSFKTALERTEKFIALFYNQA